MERLIKSIAIMDYRLFAYHGWYAEERVLGQWFVVNAELSFLSNDSSETLHLDDTLDYVQLQVLIQQEMAKPHALLENLGAAILQGMKSLAPDYQRLYLRIQKERLALPSAQVKSALTWEILKS